MPRSVTISTGSRLHFGFLTQGSDVGREFGGIGLMICSPGWSVTVQPGEAGLADDHIEVSAEAQASNPSATRRTQSFLNQLREDARFADSRWSVKVDRAIEGHQGLGSGTQLGLALSKAVALLTDTDAPIDELALRVGRGRRSAVGIWGFEQGGFIVDGGKAKADRIGSLVTRIDVPDDWCFVLVTPIEERGLSGSEELAAFAALPPMPERTTERLCSLALLSLLPALKTQKFDEFAAGLFNYGQIVGDYFRSVQGGVFSSPLMSTVAERLRAAELPAPVQTSWGPTCAIPCQNLGQAIAVRSVIHRHWPPTVMNLRVAHVLPHGAQVLT